ncbi:MAG: sodium/proline symporter [Pseudomonadales bacterium]|nr:sodium/proline symporter [Pseudomonadales bacterium]
MTILITLVAYQVVLLGIGYWARSRATTTDGYFLGDRGLGPWVASLSYAAGSSSAWSILGVSGIAFSEGLGSFWLLPGTISGHIVVWYVIAPWLRKASHEKGWLTLTDLIVDGLSPSQAKLCARISAVIVLFAFTFYIAAQFQGAANTFTAVFDFDFLSALLLGAVIVVLYTLWGGFWAVSLTDALQAVLMLVAAILLPIFALVEVGGFSVLLDAATNDGYWHWSGGHTGWFGIGFFIGMVSIGFGPIGQPHLLTRVMAIADGRKITQARIVAISWFTVVLGGMFLLGVCGHLLVVDQVDNEQIFFVLAADLLPTVVTGVLIAAVLSAIMSTADSQLLVAGSALHHDLKLDKKAKDPGKSARLAVAVVAVAAVVLAVLLPESIFSRVLFAWTALGAAFGPIVLIRFLKWSVRPGAVPIAMLGGFGLTVVFYSLPNGPGDVWERAVPFVTAFVTLWLARTSTEESNNGKESAS